MEDVDVKEPKGGEERSEAVGDRRMAEEEGAEGMENGNTQDNNCQYVTE